MDSDVRERILAQVSEEEIVSMSCDLINTPSPTGEELAMANYMRSVFDAMGLAVAWQEVEEGRPNVIGTLEGAGAGKRLMFNGHMDTSNTGREPFLTGIGYKPRAVVKNGMIYGLGIYNMKGALVCYVQAVKALQRAGIRPAGDVIIAAVVGEIEKSQWGDEFVGREYRGYGVGTHYLVNHGIVPDMCVLGEPTDMQLVLGHYGSLWVRISTHGPYLHTGFSSARQAENSIRRMQDVLRAVFAWIPSWEERGAYGGQKGIVNVGAIRGGHPWRASRTPERTDLFLDIRVPPRLPLQDARRAVAELFAGLRRQYPAYGLEFETYVSVPGAEISPEHEMVKAIEAAHLRVTGSPARRDTVLWSSDASVLTRYGIETVNYGPSSGPRNEEGEKVAIKTLVEMTKIYALVTEEICGGGGAPAAQASKK